MVRRINFLEKKYPEYDFYFIIGSDLYTTMYRWNEFEKIKKEINCILIHRKGYESDNFNFDKLPSVSFCITNSDACIINFSSTEARSLLKKKDLSEKDLKRLKEFFSENVLEYIQSNNLYSKTN